MCVMASTAATEGFGVTHRVLSHRPHHFFSVQPSLWVDSRCPCFQGTPTGLPPSQFPREGGTHDTAQRKPRAAVLWPCFQDLLQFSVHASIVDRQLMTGRGLGCRPPGPWGLWWEGWPFLRTGRSWKEEGSKGTMREWPALLVAV